MVQAETGLCEHFDTNNILLILKNHASKRVKTSVITASLRIFGYGGSGSGHTRGHTSVYSHLIAFSW